MKWILVFFIFIFLQCPLGATGILNKVPKETLKIEQDSFYDPNVDYSIFSGRVTDRDEAGTIFKISSETKNIKYFRAADLVQFKIQNNQKTDYCDGYVRSIEENYFVIFVKDLSPCFKNDDYFRRGTALIFYSKKLELRVKEAAIYRATLVQKKRDYLKQLNNINQDIYTYEEKKIQIASEFDKKIAELELKKIKELDRVLSVKNDQIRLQRELTYRLDSIDKELLFYRTAPQELLYDRWHLDQDQGLPVYKRPEPLRP